MSVRSFADTEPEPSRSLAAHYLGRRAYGPIHDWMGRLQGMRTRGEIGDLVLLLEHEPVITLGRGAKASHILAAEDRLAQMGIAVVETGRGGDVTLHAPGQLVAYPIVDLSPDRRDVRRYVGGLTNAMQSLVSPYGIAGGTVDQLIGLWTDARNPGHWPGQEQASDPRKIGAIGVRISRWVTQHGFALNLTTDLSLFQLIVPCGIRERGVTSVRDLSGHSPSVHELAPAAHAFLAHELGAPLGASSDLSDMPIDRLVSGAPPEARTAEQQPNQHEAHQHEAIPGPRQSP